jgi:hypothetical protein
MANTLAGTASRNVSNSNQKTLRQRNRAVSELRLSGDGFMKISLWGSGRLAPYEKMR